MAYESFAHLMTEEEYRTLTIHMSLGEFQDWARILEQKYRLDSQSIEMPKRPFISANTSCDGRKKDDL